MISDKEYCERATKLWINKLDTHVRMAHYLGHGSRSYEIDQFRSMAMGIFKDPKDLQSICEMIGMDYEFARETMLYAIAHPEEITYQRQSQIAEIEPEMDQDELFTTMP